MTNRLSVTDANKLKQDLDSLIRVFVKETGEYPSQIYLVAEAHSQLRAEKYVMKQRIC